MPKNPKSKIQNPKSKKAYAAAGVDVDLGNRVKSGIQALVKGTHGPEVLGRIGGFGGLFRPNFRGMKDPVLVSSVDGVGTKLKLAFMTGRHDTMGQDLVNHCVNDIAVIGARPLFFLDYIGAEKLEPAVFTQLLKGFAKACKAAGCAIVGGETAQMPGMYQPGEYDLAGTIVGVVDRPKLLDGSRIRSGDVILGMESNGLHTNGYTLARKVLFEQMGLKLTSKLDGVKGTLADELLRVHRNYQPALAKIPHGIIKGLAHITGGGLVDNLPRVLPKTCDAVIKTDSWKVPAIFQHIERGGKVDHAEMYQVFNMGIGMTVVVAPLDALSVAAKLKARVIGHIERGSGIVRLA
ncbi:phosphoribosylformylglycinamidine cyclo-ligase [Verrucomicrobiota bacterium]|jgi:phosphoribosylformylglycinamidine cyclo-ligase|nr:phosphoribosylformylglycinamidine cyclo-ligase [Verrucomicrobiota bacterium]